MSETLLRYWLVTCPKNSIISKTAIFETVVKNEFKKKK